MAKKAYNSFLQGEKDTYESLGCVHLAGLDILQGFDIPDEDKGELDNLEYLRGQVHAQQRIIEELLAWKRSL